jgi:serine/threonine-protein kinase
VPDILAGYSVVQKLGVGARSQVYQVEQTGTGQMFTLKRVIREDHEDDRFLVQAINEYEVSSALDHPHLRKAYALHRVRSLFRMKEVQVVMEYIEGVGLEVRRPEAIEEVIEVFQHVAQGLDAMHEAGFLHTDIKPNNVLVMAGGGVKIIDFGQSCRIGTRKPRIQGTPDYIAPEQVEREALDRRTDVFNFGATLYWALTGQAYPTVISRKGGTTEAVSTPPTNVPTPCQLRPEVPPGLSKLAMDACAFERHRRPRGMREILDRLDVIRTGLRSPRPGQAAPPAAVVAGREEPRPVEPATDDSDDALDYSALREVVERSRRGPRPAEGEDAS